MLKNPQVQQEVVLPVVTVLTTHPIITIISYVAVQPKTVVKTKTFIPKSYPILKTFLAIKELPRRGKKILELLKQIKPLDRDDLEEAEMFWVR